MIIDLASVGVRPKAIELTASPDEVGLDIEGTALIGNTGFYGETERVEGKAHVRGKITATVSIDCTRCLEPIGKELEIPFDAVFVDPADVPHEAEIVLEADELDESVAEDGKIDIAGIVREQILLELPDQTFCREDCKGLCPICGGNRNLIDCKCEDNEIDPRWAALKNFR